MAPPSVRLTLLVCLLAATAAAGQRFAITYHQSADVSDVRTQLEDAGYAVIKHLASMRTFAVQAAAGNKASASTHSRRLRAMRGVRSAVVDPMRTLAQAAPTTTPTSPCATTCMYNDKPSTTVLPNSTFPAEILPYGVQMIQGDSAILKPAVFLNNTIICLINSGVDTAHPDLAGNNLQGCSPDEWHACPLAWQDALDTEGFGTQAAGTMAALQNGVGAIGVIPGGVTIYTVKVYNDSGLLVFSSDLIEAYQQCENALDLAQIARPTEAINMVVHVNIAINDPVALEARYFKRAGLRGDMMWVASSGLYATIPQYPANYAEVISVASVDCNGLQTEFSAANPDVELSAPGRNIATDLATGIYLQAGFLNVSGGSANDVTYPPPDALCGVNSTSAGSVSVAGVLVDCGLAEDTCTGVEGAVCLILRGVVSFRAKLESCKAGGGVGAVVYNRANLDGCATVDPLYEDDFLPAVTVVGEQGVALKALLDANVTVTASVRVTVAANLLITISNPDLAAAHVSAAAARVWNLYPKCTSADVRAALRSSAMHKGKGAAGVRNYEYGYGIVQAADAAVALSKAKCARK